jgi:two-component system sensor histidine kinase BaeS
VNLDQLLAATAQEVEPFLRMRGQTLTVELPENMEPITADAEKLRDIIDNLLSNAIRFSPDGASIGIEVVDREAEVEIIVRDSGPGIPPEDLPYIFEPFYQGQKGLAYHSSGEYEYMTRGIGLGLGIVRRFAQLHGGSARAESSEKGAVFHVILPKHPATDTRGARPSPAAAAAG